MTTNPDLQQLLTKIKGEADRLCAVDLALTRLEAYEQAIIGVFMVAAEEQQVSPFEAKVLQALGALHHDTPKAIAFARRDVALRLHLDGIGIDDWTLSRTLNSLEQRGLVCRPAGPRAKKWALDPIANPRSDATVAQGVAGPTS